MSVERAAGRPLIHRWRWLAVPPLVVVVIAVLVIVRTGSAGNDNRSEITPAEIARRSGDAMAAIPILRVESAEWPVVPRQDQVYGIDVTEYTRDTSRFVHSSEYDLPACPAQDFSHQVFTHREQGGFAHRDSSYASPGATAPSDFELLREDTAEGEEAWVIRYSFQRAGVEGPIRTENTEWIAKFDYRLLRQESVYLDAGSMQVVSIPIPVSARATDCPSKPLHSLDDLTPRTTPGIGYD